MNLIDKFRPPHIWKKKHNKWLFKPVYDLKVKNLKMPKKS